MSLGRNDPCPCGSGLKVKRCHAGTWTPFMTDPEFRPEGDEPGAGWSRETFRETGCPYGVCTWKTEGEGPCAGGCGV